MKLLYLLPLVLFPWCLDGQITFSKITDMNNPAVHFTNDGFPYKGVAWIDLDQDNRPDLFVSNQGLFHNEGNGNFSQLPSVAGAGGGQIAEGSSWGDLDNDGDVDCITTSIASGFHQNNGDNTFTLLNGTIPNFTQYAAWDCALADADNNGRLDAVFVFACCSFLPANPVPGRLYLQDAQGGFTAVSGYEFTDITAPYTIPTWYDYDLDGDMDLFIGTGPANGTPQPDFNYRNMLQETGSFSLQRLTTFPFMVPQDGQTYNFIDYDNDGDLDICLTNYAAAPNRLYRNDNGTYVSISTPFTITGQHLANCWGDLDNDGYLDLLLTADGTANVRMYRNKRDGTFAGGLTAGNTGVNASGLALADYDNDGDLGFYANGAGEVRSLFRNNLSNNLYWAQFTLQGTTSNRSAIGAEIRVKAVLDSVARWQIRQVVAHNSFQGQNDLRQHFGLGNATQIDSVLVRWPSGLRESFSNLAGNNFYKIIEGQGITTKTSEPDAAAKPDLVIWNNPANNSFYLRSGNNDAITAIELFDGSGRIFSVQPVWQNDSIQVNFPHDATAGFYYVRAHYASGKSATRQVIKQ